MTCWEPWFLCLWRHTSLSLSTFHNIQVISIRKSVYISLISTLIHLENLSPSAWYPITRNTSNSNTPSARFTSSAPPSTTLSSWWPSWSQEKTTSSTTTAQEKSFQTTTSSISCKACACRTTATSLSRSPNKIKCTSLTWKQANTAHLTFSSILIWDATSKLTISVRANYSASKNRGTMVENN